jgi:hypothetical protein
MLLLMEFVILFKLPSPFQFIFEELAGMCLGSLSKSVSNTHSVQVLISEPPIPPPPPPPPPNTVELFIWGQVGGGANSSSESKF